MKWSEIREAVDKDQIINQLNKMGLRRTSKDGLRLYTINPDGTVDLLDSPDMYADFKAKEKHQKWDEPTVGYVQMNGIDSKEITTPLNKVHCSFMIVNCGFTTLTNFPQEVEGEVAIRLCKNLFTLKGLGDSFIKKRLDLESLPKLKNLEGMDRCVIGTTLELTDLSSLQSLKGMTKNVHHVFLQNLDKLDSFDGLPPNLVTLGIIKVKCLESLVGISDIIRELGHLTLDTSKVKRGGIGLLLIDKLTKITNQQSTSYGQLSEPFKIIEKYLGHPEKIFDCQTELIDKGFEEYAQV